MSKARYDSQQLNDMVLQMMETELGGEQVYRTAIRCALNPDLKSAPSSSARPCCRGVRGLCHPHGVPPVTAAVP